MKLEIVQSEAEAPSEVPDAEMMARVFTAPATFFAAHSYAEVPTLVGHIERLRGGAAIG